MIDATRRRENANRRVRSYATETQRHLRNAEKARLRQAHESLTVIEASLVRGAWWRPDNDYEAALATIEQAQAISELRRDQA